MRKIHYFAGFPAFLACALLPACSAEEDAPVDFAARLERDTGTAWKVYTDPRNHEVRFLAPTRPVQIGTGTPEEKARAFFARYSDSLHASGKSDEIRIVGTANDSRGGVHVRFAHFLPGTDLPVFASGSTAHFTETGAVYWLETDFRADLAHLDGKATVSIGQAKTSAIAHVASTCRATPGKTSANAADLGVFADPSAPAALAYRIAVDTESEGCRAPSVFVDAKSGTVITLEERAHAIDALVRGSRAELLQEDDRKVISVVAAPGGGGKKKYRMVTDTEVNTRVITQTFHPAAVIESRDLYDWEAGHKAKGAGVDAHYYSQKALEFLRPFANQFRGHDRAFVYPLSLDLFVTVHDNSKANSDGFNAYAWFDSNTKQDTIHFGDGNFPKMPNAMPFSAAYDVVVHEIGHLVTMHTSDLRYERESGALNESFSDVMGAAGEHALFPNEDDNFRIGEKLFFRGPPGSMTELRSMVAPEVDHVELMTPCTWPSESNDYCGVHGNSGIPNRAFSLIVQGGAISMPRAAGMPAETRPIGVSEGIGWERATELTYWATTGLNATATFENAALAQEAEAARFLEPLALIAVRCAWYAVGVNKLSTVADTWYTQTFCSPAVRPSWLPPPPPESRPSEDICSGRGDSVVCDPAHPSQAIACNSRGEATTEYCGDPGTTCKRVSPGDPTAVKDDNGVLVCE